MFSVASCLTAVLFPQTCAIYYLIFLLCVEAEARPLDEDLLNMPISSSPCSTSYARTDDVSVLDKVIVKTKALAARQTDRSSSTASADNSLVATYKFICRIGHVFALKNTMTTFLATPHPLLKFGLWLLFVSLCYHPRYLLYLPHVLLLVTLMLHRLYLTTYKYSSAVSFEQIKAMLDPEASSQALHKDVDGPEARLPVNNYSLLKNLADMNASTTEFLETFDYVVDALESWMNEKPSVTYTRWLAVLFSMLGLHLLTLFFHVNDILAAAATIGYIFSHVLVRNVSMAFVSVIRHEMASRGGGHQGPLFLRGFVAVASRAIYMLKLALFKVVHYFLTMRIWDSVFHDPKQSIQDFDLDPAMFQ